MSNGDSKGKCLWDVVPVASTLAASALFSSIATIVVPETVPVIVALPVAALPPPLLLLLQPMTIRNIIIRKYNKTRFETLPLFINSPL